MPAAGEGGGPSQGRPGGHSIREQEELWREVLDLAAEVESAYRSAVTALCEGRLDLVDAVVAREAAVDRWEVRIEEACLRVLALYGLVASDLRRVMAALRINRDLEGLADLAENLAKRASGSSPATPPRPPSCRDSGAWPTSRSGSWTAASPP